MTSPARSGARLVALVCTAQVFVQIGAFYWPALLPQMMRHWSLTNGEAGWITSAFYGAYMLSVPVLVTLTDRIDAKRVYLFGVAATTVALFAFGLLADGFWSAYWLHLLTGLCSGGNYTPALALINDHVERARRGVSPARPWQGSQHAAAIEDRPGIAGPVGDRDLHAAHVAEVIVYALHFEKDGTQVLCPFRDIDARDLLDRAATAAIAWFIFHEHFDRRIAIGMLCLVAGAATLAIAASRVTVNAPSSPTVASVARLSISRSAGCMRGVYVRVRRGPVRVRADSDQMLTRIAAMDVSVYEAKANLSKLLKDVEAGREVTITRHGRPVARLVPVLREAMEEAVPLDVPLTVDVKVGDDWEGMRPLGSAEAEPASELA